MAQFARAPSCSAHRMASGRYVKRKGCALPFATVLTTTINRPVRFGGLIPAPGPRWAAALSIVIPTIVRSQGLGYAYNGLGRGPTRPSKLGGKTRCGGPACGRALGGELMGGCRASAPARGAA